MPVLLSAPAHGLREWTTAQARPVERLDYWVGAICEAFLEMDCSSRAADCFEGSLTHLPLERLAVNRVLASTQDVYRTPASIACSQSFPFYLIAQLDHPWHVKQGGQVLHLRPGDAVLVDAAQPYERHFPHWVACLSVQMPRAWVGEWLTALDVPDRAPHPPRTGLGRGAVVCLQLGRDPALAAHMAPAGVEEQFGALLAAAQEPPRGPAGAATQDLHARAVAWMRERLEQPGLRAADLAQHLGVSPRSLHRAFARVTPCPDAGACRSRAAEPMARVGQTAGAIRPSGCTPDRWIGVQQGSTCTTSNHWRPHDRTCVLVHGAWHTDELMAPVTAHLRPRGHTVHCPTRAGNRPGDDRATTGPAEAAQSLIDFLNEHDLQRVRLMGHSCGGMVISHAVDRVGRRIRRLVYVSPIRPAWPTPSSAPVAIDTARRQGPVAWIQGIISGSEAADRKRSAVCLFPGGLCCPTGPDRGPSLIWSSRCPLSPSPSAAPNCSRPSCTA